MLRYGAPQAKAVTTLRDVAGGPFIATRGLSVDRIGEDLSIPPFTVKRGVNRAMVEPDAPDRVQLVVVA